MGQLIVHREVEVEVEGVICLQWIEEGGQSYRFAWKGADGKYRRGSPRIPSAGVLLSLLAKASKEGWFGQPEKGLPYVRWMLNEKKSRTK